MYICKYGFYDLSEKFKNAWLSNKIHVIAIQILNKSWTKNENKT
jgi:hypothetical protein